MSNQKQGSVSEFIRKAVDRTDLDEATRFFFGGYNPEDLQAFGCCDNPVQIYLGNKWSCETCGKEMEVLNRITTHDPFYGTPRPQTKCECGAAFTQNANCHSAWCPKFEGAK